MTKRRTLLALVATALMLGHTDVAAGAQAPVYPTKAVRLIVPFPAGGAIDVTARIIARELSERLGKQFVVENRPGGSGMIGVNAVKRSEPDGYTLAMITSVTHGSNPAVSRNLGYDPHNDLKPIVWLAQAPHALLVTRKLSVQTVSELVDLIRSQPGRLNYGSGGVGSMHHLGMVMLVRRWKKVVSRGVVRSVYLAGPHSAQRNSSTL